MAYQKVEAFRLTNGDVFETEIEAIRAEIGYRKAHSDRQDIISCEHWITNNAEFLIPLLYRVQEINGIAKAQAKRAKPKTEEHNEKAPSFQDEPMPPNAKELRTLPPYAGLACTTSFMQEGCDAAEEDWQRNDDVKIANPYESDTAASRDWWTGYNRTFTAIEDAAMEK